jgi:hypothetical protein
MRESKLCQHLLLIPEPMRKQFRLYLASPYFNPLPRFVDLLDILEANLLKYKSRDMTEEAVWLLYFPKNPFDRNKLRKDCTALLKLLVAFLSQAAFDLDRPLQFSLLIRQLNTLELHPYFKAYAEEAAEVLKEAEANGKPVFGIVADIGLEHYRNDLAQNFRNSDVDLGELIDAAELDYCIRKMELLYVKLNHWIVTAKGQRRQEEAFLELVQSRLTDLPAQTKMYYHLYECTREASAESHFHAFRELLRGMQPSPNRADMYLAALNYCARRLNVGRSDYLSETHFLHREMLDLGLMAPVLNQISPNFKNAVVVAARLGEFAWARKLIGSHHETLELPQNLNAGQFAEGIIAFHEGNLQQAEPYFHRLLGDFEDIFYGLDARGYLLRIYYELGNQIGLESLLESYRMYIKRNPALTPARRESHSEFIRYVRRLTHVNPHDEAAITRLETEIQAGSRIPATAWLLQKVQMLKRR